MCHSDKTGDSDYSADSDDVSVNSGKYADSGNSCDSCECVGSGKFGESGYSDDSCDSDISAESVEYCDSVEFDAV